MFSFLYVLGTCGYTIVQFFCYTGATHKKTATQWLHSYTRKSGWFMHLTRCTPRKSGQIAGLLLIRVAVLGQSLMRDKADFRQKSYKYWLFKQVKKQPFLQKTFSNIRTSLYVTPTNFLKNSKNRHLGLCICQKCTFLCLAIVQEKRFFTYFTH